MLGRVPMEHSGWWAFGIALALALLAWMVRRLWRSARARWRGRAAVRAERRAERLLADEGYRIEARQPTYRYTLHCGGEALEITLRPDLIVLAYGTNEGFNDRLDVSRYRHSVRRTLRTLKEAAPYASFAVAAPPDAARMPKHCPRAARKTATCRPLSDSERLNYQKMIRAKSPALCRWHAPPKLGQVRGVLAELARDEGYFYWDWSEVMGSSCGIEGWVKRKPKLAHGDRVHMTNRGYRRSADSLYKALRGDARCQSPAILSAN